MIINHINSEDSFHLTHNANVAEELIFLLKTLDTSKTFYLPEELRKLWLIEEVKSKKYEVWHSEQYRKLKSKEKLMGGRNPLSVDDAEKCYLAFEKFENNPNDQNYDYLSKTKYTTAKTFGQVWAETCRDIHQLFSYMGILPAYYKGRSASSNRKHIVSPYLKDYKNGELSIEELLMGVKFSNSVVNKDVKMYRRSIRPFYMVLEILITLKNENIEHIHNHLCSGIITCLTLESQFRNELKNELIEKLSINNNLVLENIANINSSFKKNIARFTQSSVKVLKELDLIKDQTIGQNSYISITEKGIHLLNKTPKNLVTSNSLIGTKSLTPLLGFILNEFKKNSLINDTCDIDRNSFESRIKSFFEISSDELNDIFQTIKNEIDPSPLLSITEETIVLNQTNKQVLINPYTDFSDFEICKIVDNRSINQIISPIQVEPLEVPIDEEFELLTNNLLPISIGSDGNAYEEVVYSLSKKIFGESRVKHFGTAYTGSRISDIVWKVPINRNFENKNLLVILECKAGNSIRQFNDRDVVEQIDNTINEYRRDVNDIAGFWYIITDGANLPVSNNTHGGYRPGSYQLGFEDKLLKIWDNILSRHGKPFKISAFNNLSFKTYIMYLYKVLSEIDLDRVSLHNGNVGQFFDWGSQFQPKGNYTECLNYKTEEELELLLGNE